VYRVITARIEDLAAQEDRAENSKPRRARILGPIRYQLKTEREHQAQAAERVKEAKTKVEFSTSTMQGMEAVVLKFGWTITTDGDAEPKLQPHPKYAGLA